MSEKSNSDQNSTQKEDAGTNISAVIQNSVQATVPLGNQIHQSQIQTNSVQASLPMQNLIYANTIQSNLPETFVPPSGNQIQQSQIQTNSIPITQNINGSTLSTTQKLFQNIQMSPQNSLTFDDDDEITQKETLKNPKQNNVIHNLDELLTLNVKTNQQKIKLNKNNDRQIPVHVSFNTSSIDFTLENRAHVDLVCVIDRSGSMGGEKIKLVKESFNFLLELLGENDRISIVTFQNSSSRLTKLTRTTPENKEILLKNINKIFPSGGTNINSGVQMALEILKQRRFKNDQATIFVLSDGVDNIGKQAKSVIEKTMQSYEKHELLIGSYTLNTFGYGKDTDSETMSAIAELKDGTFFYIEKLDMVDECFVDCLGSILTSVGQNANLIVSSQSSEILPNINFSKGMGGDKLWVSNNSKTEFVTKISKLIIGKSKDFILELNIPKSNAKLDSVIELPVVNVVLTAEGFNVGGSTEVIKKVAELKILVFTDNLDEKEIEESDSELFCNYYRLKLAETMEKAKNLADLNKFEDAKKLLVALELEISKSMYSTNQKVKLFLEEIKIALRDVQPNIYGAGGSHNLTSNMHCNLKQSSKPTNVQYENYTNNIQQDMNRKLKMSKKK